MTSGQHAQGQYAEFGAVVLLHELGRDWYRVQRANDWEEFKKNQLKHAAESLHTRWLGELIATTGAEKTVVTDLW